MILYFADREMKILGQASTELPKGFIISDDLKSEEVETGVAVFSCYVSYKNEDQLKLKEMCKTGNYLLRCNGDEQEFYTIIDSEKDTKAQEFYIYAEDAGLDLLNEVVGEYKATELHPAAWYISQLAADAGFEIGINEIPEALKLQLTIESESTATKRIAEIAAAFGGFEVSYSFKIEGLSVTHKYINIHEKRGVNTSEPLRLNKELDRIVVKETINNLATELVCEGGTPDDSEDPITLEGYFYDDGDFYTDGKSIKSRKALAKWGRLNGGHIAKPFSCEALSQSELCTEAIAKLKTVCDSELNIEVDINRLPDNVKIGDKVNVIDDSGEQYFSTRLLLLENSVVKKQHKATLGEHLIKTDGISQKVKDLAAQFAKQTISVKRAQQIANNAVEIAEKAQTEAETAATEAENALSVSEEAKTAANTATQSAAGAQAKAEAAEAAANKVEESVASLRTTVNNAQQAADNAQQAADTAETKAEEAKTAAANALKEATEAKEAAGTAQSSADSAINKADTAINTANTAKDTAEAASTTAQAAKLDAEQAEKDIAEFAENLTTLENTMSADYARKTDLTEATASLQTQITQNANEISSTASKVQKIDETANNAAEQAQSAQSTAALAQEQANAATAEAEAAQTAADNAALAAQNAQAEADSAKAAAATAQSVADKAETDLEAAKADLLSVSSRVDATEEEIATAQAAVNAAQAAANKAKADASEAAEKAATAQNTANTAVSNADSAQQAANNAAEQAAIAKQVAEQAQGNAEAAQARADEAAEIAEAAQATANTAKSNATAAQTRADQAAADAAAAQQKANAAEAKALQAETDLEAARQNLADVTSRVGATEEEVAAAQAAVEAAQAAASKAKADAEAAQSTADTAKANAATAQAAADNAKTAADNAQAKADEAKTAADKAQADVNALEVRVTTAETQIIQNSEEITLRATKTEVTEAANAAKAAQETADKNIKEIHRYFLSQPNTLEKPDKPAEYPPEGTIYSPLFTNLADPTSVDWKEGYRLNSSGAPTQTTDGSSTVLTQYIDCSQGDVIRIKGITLGGYRVALYTGSATKTNYKAANPTFPSSDSVWDCEEETAGVYKFTVNYASASAMRFSGILVGTSNDVIITANEEIKYGYITLPNSWTETEPTYQSDNADSLYYVDCFVFADNTYEYSDVLLSSSQEAINAITTRVTAAETSITQNAEKIELRATKEELTDTTQALSASIIEQVSNMIRMCITDGNNQSLMVQTENGWTFSTASLQSTVNGTAEDLDELINTVGGIDATVDILNKSVEELGALAEYVKIGTYTYTDEDGAQQTEPSIDLGENDTGFKLKITNTRICFTDGANELVWIDSKEKALNTQKISVDEINIGGGWVWQTRNNGKNLGLAWKGAVK